MSTAKTSGFTIIELMLFVAISGALTVALLGGWSLSVNTQSYKDSVRSTADDLRSEYNAVYNINNDRDKNFSCNSGGVVLLNAGNSGAPTDRGTTDCIIMGRIVSVRGTTVNSKAVIGEADATADPNYTTEQVFKEYNPKVADVSINTNDFSVPWSSTLKNAGSNPTNASFDMLIIRSPVNGSVSTYIRDSSGGDPDIDGLINYVLKNERSICIEPSGPIAGGTLGIRIAKNASTAAAVTVLGDADSSGACS